MAEGIIQVSDAEFDSKVLGSDVPVVVDFWAPWCGPCRMLGPVLEAVAADFPDDLVVAKVNSDENQELARRYAVQGIPAVKFIRRGQLVAEFTGALPKRQVEAYVMRLLPSEADELADEGARAWAAGRRDDAEAAFRQAIDMDPRQSVALLGLAEVALAAGRYSEAENLFLRVPPGTAEAARADQRLGMVRLATAAGDLPSADEARARLSADSADAEAHLALGLHDALAGQHDAALDRLLGVIQRGGPHKEAGKNAVVAIFEALGPQHELTRRFRPRLAALLY